MSGFVVLFNPDRAPVDCDLLAGMTAFLARGGPDGTASWSAPGIGLGHALLRASWEDEHERQPLTLGQDVWIVADARVDGREDLWRRLGREPGAALARTPDSALLLLAYLKWGEQCVDHVIGDFSLVVWDGRERRLFAARDHFGVRPLYYARAGPTWVLSNRLDAVRLHPAVPDDLHEPAVIDFLLFECNQELDTTFFAAIRKLPPAHGLRIADGAPAVRRYWSIPEPDLLWLKRDEDYLEQFRFLLEQAAGDRLRTDRAAVWFSGGLDSTNLTAAALAAGRRRGRPLELTAVTAVYDRILPDRERHFATIAAEALGVPLEFVVADDWPLFADWDKEFHRTSDPGPGPRAGVHWGTAATAARHGRVVLYGEGADEILPTWKVRDLRRHLPLSSLGRCVLRSCVRHRLPPPWGTGLHDAWRRWRRTQPDYAARFPAWLAPALANRPDVRERFARVNLTHQARPGGRCAAPFLLPLWARLLQECADLASQAHLVVALPYLDLRLLNFAWQLPPYPWGITKYLLRRLGRPRLPAAILERPKTALAGDPCGAKLPNREAWQTLAQRLALGPEWEPYVSRAALPRTWETERPGIMEVWTNLRPFILAAWAGNGRSRPRLPRRTASENSR